MSLGESLLTEAPMNRDLIPPMSPGSVILQYYIVYALPNGKFPSPLMRWSKLGTGMS